VPEADRLVQEEEMQWLEAEQARQEALITEYRYALGAAPNTHDGQAAAVLPRYHWLGANHHGKCEP